MLAFVSYCELAVCFGTSGYHGAVVQEKGYGKQLVEECLAETGQNPCFWRLNL